MEQRTGKNEQKQGEEICISRFIYQFDWIHEDILSFTLQTDIRYSQRTYFRYYLTIDSRLQQHPQGNKPTGYHHFR